MEKITEALENITKEITNVNHEIKAIIQGEGLETQLIDEWINSLNKIIRLTDHTTEILEESK